MDPPITLCLTLGLRPDHLRRTLESLTRHAGFSSVIGINAFGDAESSAVFRSFFANATLIVPGRRVRQHRAVDKMYGLVKTPYVFHCEDDWEFDRALCIKDCVAALESDPRISQICLRKVSDFNLSEQEMAQLQMTSHDRLSLARLDASEPFWHGFTFNPHIAALEQWRRMGGFWRFPTEWHVSRWMRRNGRHTVYCYPGSCHHIGADYSVAMTDLKDRIYKDLMRRFLAIDV